jgi:hypothetical protein
MRHRVSRYDEWPDAQPDAEPYFEPDSFEWIVEPTSPCDSPRCFAWFRTGRAVCPYCRFPRQRKR